MKEIALSPKRIKAAKLLTKGHWRTQLRQVSEAAFAVTDNDHKPFAFHSSSLALYFAESKPDIANVILIQQKTQMGVGARDGKVLQLELEDETIVYLYNDDQLHIAPVHKLQDPIGMAVSPADIWDIPSDSFAGKILLTESMLMIINYYAPEDAQKAHVLNILWKEYALAASKASSPPETLTIKGEFIPYKVLQHSGGLVIFDHNSL